MPRVHTRAKSKSWMLSKSKHLKWTLHLFAFLAVPRGQMLVCRGEESDAPIGLVAWYVKEWSILWPSAHTLQNRPEAKVPVVIVGV